MSAFCSASNMPMFLLVEAHTHTYIYAINEKKNKTKRYRKKKKEKSIHDFLCYVHSHDVIIFFNETNRQLDVKIYISKLNLY